MAAIARLTGAPSASGNDWKAIDWQKVRREVRRLQTRIAKAVREGRHGRVKALQWLLTRSFSGKALAVKRVVSNRGRKTPGVDGIVWYTPRQRMKAVQALRRRGYQARPLRRVYIPKKNGKMRPLGIPTMHDRAMQALHALALQPVAETTGDPNSYGFRLYRSCADAIHQCYIGLAKRYSAQWILEGDIKACLDTSSYCTPCHEGLSNRPCCTSNTLIYKPVRLPEWTWRAETSPRFTRCNTVWRETPMSLIASSIGT